MLQTLPGTDISLRDEAAHGPLLWAFTGLALYLLVGGGSLFVTAFTIDPLLAALGLPAQSGLLGLSIRNAVHPLVWGALVAAISMPLGRRLIGGTRFALDGWLVLATGLVLASATWFLTEEFVRARFAEIDVEYAGLSFFIWPAVVAVALSGWATLAIPRRAAIPPLTLLLLAVLGMAIALLPSAIGAGDGIEPGNIPLALVLLLDVGYAIAVVALALRRNSPQQPA